MLHYYELDDKYEEVREWYDGYHFGKADIYCPWDVVNYCNDHLNNPDTEPENYWMKYERKQYYQSLYRQHK